MRMESNNLGSSTDQEYMKDDVKSVGFHDFDFEENHIWCDQCKKFKQEIKKLQDEHALNYSTLKKKIISTDLLIKKYKAKCDDYDAQTKKHEEFYKKYEQLKSESETLTTQLQSTLLQIEPLRKAKLDLESDNKQKHNEIQALQNKIIGCELAVKQYEEISKESSTYKDRYDILKKEKTKKVQTLESINTKNESLINKLKEDTKNLRNENAAHLRKQRKMEGKINKVVDKMERYWNILRQHGLLPKGEKKPQFEKYVETNGTISVSQDEDDTAADDEDEDEAPSIQEEKINDDKFPWIFSPLVAALSPLPPSPMPCRMNKPLMSNICDESDEENIDEMANLLESELLRSSPVRQSFKPQSLLRKVQTRSPLIECKQKQETSILNVVNKDVKPSHTNSNVNDLSEIGGESLSDSDTENVVANNNRLNLYKQSVDSVDKSDRLRDDMSKTIDERGDNLGSTVNSINKSDKVVDHKIDHSENSVFKKIQPKLIPKTDSLNSGKHNEENSNFIKENVCLEAFPIETREKTVKNKNSDISSVEKLKGLKSSLNTSRKIDFIDNSAKHSIEPKIKDGNLSYDQSHDSEDVTIEMDKSNDTGFDLDSMFYDSYEANDKSTEREFCETPKLDFLHQKVSKTVTMQQDNENKAESEKQNAQKENSNLLQDRKENCSLINRESSPDRLLRQVSEGFVLKSPPCIFDADVSKVNSASTHSKHVKERRSLFAQKSDTHKMDKFYEKITKKEKEVLDSSNLDANINETAKTERKLPHQGSMGFRVDLDNDNAQGQDESSEVKTFTKANKDFVSNDSDDRLSAENKNVISAENEVKNRISSEVKDKKDIHSENELLKQKYLLFVESRRSSQDSVGSQRSSQDSVGSCRSSQDSVGSRRSSQDSIGLRQSSQDSVESSENISITNVKKGDNQEEIQLLGKTRTIETEVSLSSHENDSIEKDKHNHIHNEKTLYKSSSNVLMDSSHLEIPAKKKTLQQLVLQGLETKSVPSSTVISPEVSDINKHRKKPVSRSSSHSSSPLSPLPVSPFDFSIPMLISPLPPSPVRHGEPLSPLPGSPWIDDDDVPDQQSNKSSPVNFVKKAASRKTNSRPCSFSSDVPSHAIHVKPLNTCKITPAKTQSKFEKTAPVERALNTCKIPPAMTPSKPVQPIPAERDPLSLGRKQRVSRVPKQATTTQKRKSLEPIASDVKEKKCKEEKQTTISHDPLPVQQETGYWKDVELCMQRYICVYDMTPEDVRVKLLTDKDPAAVLPAVVIWTTQYLRSSETEMYYNMYEFCKGTENAKPGPYLTTAEIRLADFFIFIIQNNIWNEFKTKLLDALWNCIMLKDVVTILGRTALCRVFTAVCQKEGNVEYVRVLFYNIVTCCHLKFITLGLSMVGVWPEVLYKTDNGKLEFITLGLSMVGVWPEVLYKTDSESSSLVTTMEFCVFKVLLKDKEKHEKMITCFTTLCNWTVPKKLDTTVYMKRIVQNLQNVTRQDESNSVVSDKQFDLCKSLELILLTEDNMFFKRAFTMTCLNQMFQKIKCNNNFLNGGYPVMYIKNIINITATTLARKIESKFAAKTINRFMFGLMTMATVTMEVQEYIANTMLDIAFVAPMPVFSHLMEWFRKERKSVSCQLKNRMETVRTQLQPYEGKLTSYSFK